VATGSLSSYNTIIIITYNKVVVQGKKTKLPVSSYFHIYTDEVLFYVGVNECPAGLEN